MDYKYIEQLLERYWECETSEEEEAILRNFFAQKEVPASLQPYRDAFLAEAELSEEKLSDDFDDRILAIVGEDEKPAVKVVPLKMSTRLRPLYKATAAVAILLTLGMAAQRGFQNNEVTTDPYAQQQVQDTAGINTDMPEVVDQASAALPATNQDSLSSTILKETAGEIAN